MAEVVCGFVLYDGNACPNGTDPGDYCVEHRWMTCAGCAGKAVRECPVIAEEEGCLAPLCNECQHMPMGKGHGRATTMRQTAAEEMNRLMRTVLESAQEEGLCTLTRGREEELAARVIGELSMLIAMRMLAGMAGAPS